jgi:CelD/BcsL family acetyltransferase involved in cellulose biosynthesis
MNAADIASRMASTQSRPVHVRPKHSSRGIEALLALADEWDHLADRAGVLPFLRPGWIAAWWRAFGRGCLEILTADRDGRLTGILPVERSGSMVRSPTNWHTPLFGMVAEGSEAAREVSHQLFALRAAHVSLSFFDADDPALPEFRVAADRAGYRPIERTLMEPWYANLEGGWETYASHTIGKRLRGKVGRSRRRLQELGSLEFRSRSGRAALADLSDAIAVEEMGWKGRERTAIASHAETRAFYEEVAAWAAGRGILVISSLGLDGRVVAAEIALQDCGRHLGLKMGFDEGLARFGPGMLMAAELMEAACEKGLSTFEFLGDGDEWKARWSTGQRRLLRFDAFAPSLLGRALYAVHLHGRPALSRVRAATERASAARRRTS